MPAPGFVPLPGGGNPAGSASAFAGDASSAYSAGLQFAAALRREAALQQHQQQTAQQADLKDQFETELKMRDKGYTPYMQRGATEPSGLKHREPQEGVDPSQVIRDHFGRQWVAPPAKPDATPQQTFTDTKGALDSGGRTVFPRLQMDESGKTTDTGMFGPNVPDQSRVIKPPGGTKNIYMPTSDEKAAQTLQQKLAAQAATPGTPTVDTEHFSSPVSIDHRSGKVTELQLPPSVTHNAKPDPLQSLIPGVSGPKGGPLSRDRQGNITELELPPGSKRQPTPGQEAMNERFQQREADKRDAKSTAAENRKQTAIDSAQRQIDVYQKQEQDQHELRQAYGAASAVADGQQVIDPHTRQPVMMNQVRRTYYKQQFVKATEQIGRLQDTQKKILGRHGGSDSGGGSGAPKDPLGLR